jgi:hypothetical protein
MVQETDPGGDTNLLFCIGRISRLAVKVYRDLYFRFVGISSDLSSTWRCHDNLSHNGREK